MKSYLVVLGLLAATTTPAYPKKIDNCKISDNIINAIIMQETRNKNVNGDFHLVNDYSVGYAQVRISTARWMLNKSISTKGFIGDVLRYLTVKMKWKLSKLLRIRFINVYFARNYLKFICKKKNGNFKKTIIAYNVGPWAGDVIVKSKGFEYFDGFIRYYSVEN